MPGPREPADAGLSGVVIRPARRDEADIVARAYAWLFAPPGRPVAGWDDRRAAADLGALIAGRSSAVLVAAEGDQLVGLCTVQLDLRSVRFGQRAWVEDLAVRPDRRSSGIGRQLLDAAKEWAREQGASHLELDSGDARHDAHRFYERERPSWTSRCFGWQL